RTVGDDHPPHMLREMPRKPENLPHEHNQPANRGSAGIEPGLAAAAGDTLRLARKMFESLRKRIHTIERKPEGFPHVANRRLRAIGNYLGGHSRALAPVLLIDVLQHLFAAFVLEIH